MVSDTFGLIGSDGGYERYPDTFRRVTTAMVASAEKAEAAVLAQRGQIEEGFLKMAFLLDLIDREELYLARGYETLKTYVASPEVQVSPRMAGDLLRIVREARPLIEAERPEADPDYLLLRAGITKVRAALPLLSREETKGGFVPLVEVAPSMTTVDVKAEVKRLRGVETPIDTRSPAVFSARVTKGETYYRVKVRCADGVDVYDAGELRIKPRHFGRFDQRFGSFIEFVVE